jgi:hypothetical protein
VSFSGLKADSARSVVITDFMPQFEVGQQELIDIHHYTYLMDQCAMGKATGPLAQIVYDINSHLVNHIYFSFNNRHNYHKMMKTDQFANNKRCMNTFRQTFLTVQWFSEYVGLGFSEINPKEKDINSLTQTGAYLVFDAACHVRPTYQSFPVVPFRCTLRQAQCFT